MAMLAEPRQRKRYNLTPRGKPLYEGIQPKYYIELANLSFIFT